MKNGIPKGTDGTLDELMQLADSAKDHIDPRTYSDVLYHELICALYLGFGWVYPDGAWTPGYHWGGQTDYRHKKIKITINNLRWSEDLQKDIDESFKEGKKYFSEADYAKLPSMFRTYFFLENEEYKLAVAALKWPVKERAMAILDGMKEDLQIRQTMTIGTKGLWYVDDERSYTNADLMERKRRAEEEVAKRNAAELAKKAAEAAAEEEAAKEKKDEELRAQGYIPF